MGIRRRNPGTTADVSNLCSVIITPLISFLWTSHFQFIFQIVVLLFLGQQSFISNLPRVPRNFTNDTMMYSNEWTLH